MSRTRGRSVSSRPVVCSELSEVTRFWMSGFLLFEFAYRLKSLESRRISSSVCALSGKPSLSFSSRLSLAESPSFSPLRSSLW